MKLQMVRFNDTEGFDAWSTAISADNKDDSAERNVKRVGTKLRQRFQSDFLDP